MLDLPETLDDLRLQRNFFNATRLLWRRAQQLDQRYASQLQPAVWLLNGRKEKDLSRWRSLVEGVNQQPPHLYHDVLQLVIWIGNVGRRQDQQPPLVVELIQQSAERLHVCIYLQRCKHTQSWSRRSRRFPGVQPCEPTHVHTGRARHPSRHWTGRRGWIFPWARTLRRSGIRMSRHSCFHPSCSWCNRAEVQTESGIFSLDGEPETRRKNNTEVGLDLCFAQSVDPVCYFLTWILDIWNKITISLKWQSSDLNHSRNIDLKSQSPTCT